jgi:hypothetical protein
MHGGKWHVVPDQEIGVNAVMRNRIEFGSGKDILEGALVYRIQRKHAESAKPAQDESKHIQLLVVWYVERTKELHVRTLIVEHDGELDEHKLRILHQKYWHLLNARVDPIKNNWQLNNATVKTKIKAMNGGYRWNIFISDKERYIVNRPFWIDTTM